MDSPTERILDRIYKIDRIGSVCVAKRIVLFAKGLLEAVLKGFPEIA
jgi:hypothetical protein